jgi:short-subunit dehydrogenase
MASPSFADRYGPWAFIAGASMGIGAALSHEAASRGLNVVLNARGKEQLERTAADVAEKHGVETRVLAADLADPDIGTLVAKAVDDIDVGLFVYNAAVAPAGRFLDVDLDKHLLSIKVNCITPTILCHYFGQRLMARGKGGIGMVTSTAGTQGAVNFATYNSGKAYEWILAESLYAEWQDNGVDVTNIFVGATASENYLAFQATLDPELCNKPNTDSPLDRARSRLMRPNPPEQVAVALYDSLGTTPDCWADPDDEFVTTKCFTLSRTDAVEVWKQLQLTSQRVPDRQAL